MTVGTQSPTPAALRQAIKWDVIQDGLYAFVVAVTGLPAVWQNQTGEFLQPPRAYASMDLEGASPIGFDGVSIVDLVKQAIANGTPAPAAGQEMTTAIFGLRSATFAVDVQSDSARFVDNAMSYAQALLAALDVPSLRQSLLDCGIAPISVGRTIDLSEVQEATYVSRVRFEVDVSFAMYGAQGDLDGYVAEVAGTATIDDGVPGSSSPATATFDVKGS